MVKHSMEIFNFERHWKAIAGGTLSIIAGIFHLFEWLAVAILLNRLIGSSTTTTWILVTPLLILAIIAIIGGAFALKKRFWGLALAGAICAIFSPVTWIMGVTATVFISISKYEFAYSNSKYPFQPIASNGDKSWKIEADEIKS
jgi:hypothetical protein